MPDRCQNWEKTVVIIFDMWRRGRRKKKKQQWNWFCVFFFIPTNHKVFRLLLFSHSDGQGLWYLTDSRIYWHYDRHANCGMDQKGQVGLRTLCHGQSRTCLATMTMRWCSCHVSATEQGADDRFWRDQKSPYGHICNSCIQCIWLVHGVRTSAEWNRGLVFSRVTLPGSAGWVTAAWTLD